MQTLIDLDDAFGDADLPRHSTGSTPVESAAESAILPFQSPDRIDEPGRWGSALTRCLVGAEHLSRLAPAVPDALLATRRITCPVCGSGCMLPELRVQTSGKCYRCWREDRS
jgi:hypothetical protein